MIELHAHPVHDAEIEAAELAIAVATLQVVQCATCRERPTAPASGQPAGRGRGPQGPPLLPTPPLTTAPTPDQDGNFVIGPPYAPAPELTVKQGVPQGTVHEFTMDSSHTLGDQRAAYPAAGVPSSWSLPTVHRRPLVTTSRYTGFAMISVLCPSDVTNTLALPCVFVQMIG